MNKILGLLIIAAVTYVWYSNESKKNKQAEQLRKEVAELRKEKEALEKKPTPAPSVPAQVTNKAQTAPVISAKLKDLQNQFNNETTKLIDLQRRKDLLNSAVTDPGQASSVQEAQQEVREKNDQIQNLQLQLTSNQADEKWVDHNGEQAKQNQNLSKAEITADANNRIRTQQQLIRNTQDAIKQNRITATGDSMSAVTSLTAQLNQQKADLENMMRAREQINVTNSAANVQIHQQMGAEKNNIRLNEDGIRGQIQSLKNEIKALQAETTGVSRTTSQLKDQMKHVDQQISAEKVVIDRLQKAIETETNNSKK